MVEDLPPGYYLDNFNRVLDFVTGQYRDLLSPTEFDWANRFRDLSLNSQRMYVRLCSRKGPLFRNDKLHYTEIETEAALERLAQSGFVDEAPDAGLDELLALLTRDELGQVAKALGYEQRKSATRDERLACLAETDCGVLREQLDFQVVQPLQMDVLQVYKLLFFGNAHQDFTEFVLHDLGISPFESYPVHPEDRFFDDRAVLESTLDSYALGEAAGEAIEANDVEAMLAIAESLPDCPQQALRRRSGRIRNRVARQLERLELLDAALDLYGRSTIAPSRERRARILHKQGEVDAAVELCRDIVSDPEDEAEFEFANNFARRILKASGATPDEFSPPGRTAFSSRCISVAQQPDVRVEELARVWFEGQGDEAWYVENGLLPGLFGLAFWDIIFHPVKGVFFNPFQRGPADLFLPEFRDSRRELIDRRLVELEDGLIFRTRVLETFRAKWPVANHFVAWSLLSEDLLERVFERIPIAHLLAIFHRLLRDLRNNRSGFPDLLVLPASGGYLLAEVKGPGDTLQNNQKRWLRHFEAIGVPAEVTYVEWA